MRAGGPTIGRYSDCENGHKLSTETVKIIVTSDNGALIILAKKGHRALLSGVMSACGMPLRIIPNNKFNKYSTKR